VGGGGGGSVCASEHGEEHILGMPAECVEGALGISGEPLVRKSVFASSCDVLVELSDVWT
jgi:hypothetical protein